MEKMSFSDVINELYDAQFDGYPAEILYEGINHPITCMVETVHIQSETFGTDHEELPERSDINKILHIKTQKEGFK